MREASPATYPRSRRLTRDWRVDQGQISAFQDFLRDDILIRDFTVRQHSRENEEKSDLAQRIFLATRLHRQSSASVRPRVDEVRERILLATDRERCCPGAGRPWADSRRVYSRGGESISCSLAHGSSKDGRIVGACRCVASSSSRIKVGHLSSPLGRRTLPDADADHSASPFPTGFLHRGSGSVGG